MKVRILKFKRSQDAQGNDKIFMMVEATTATGLYTRSEWLIEEEITAINSDESAKVIIAEEMANRAVLAKTQELAELALRNNISPN